ncbi:MAG: hypothetical protein M3P37_08130 [Actinomycetota bacterium]|nr:hypothetical protein [Actinomycetota bacterium]
MDKNVDKCPHPVEEMWTTTLLIHSTYLSTFLPTGLSTGYAPLYPQVYPQVAYQISYVGSLFSPKRRHLSTGSRFYPHILLITAPQAGLYSPEFSTGKTEAVDKLWINKARKDQKTLQNPTLQGRGKKIRGRGL